VLDVDKVTVIFQPYGKRVQVPKGTTLFEAALKAGVGLRSVCGGKGSCGKCKVIVRKGKVDFKYNVEEKLLTPEELSKGYVLACLSKCLTDCEVYVPPESRLERPKIQTEAIIPKVVPNPAIRKIYIPSDEFAVAKFLESIKEERTHLAHEIESKLMDIAESSNEGGTVILWNFKGKEVLDVELGDTRSKAYGLAIDVGTTKVVAYLVDLNTGEILGLESDYNKQLIYGEDVISRISYALEKSNGLKMVQKAVVDTINDLINRLAQRFDIKSYEIYDVCTAGNTVMTYLLIGKDPSPLLKTGAEVPRESYLINAKSIGLNVNTSAKLYCLPCAGRFLGGDVIGDIIASGMHRSQEIALLIDIGTNAEVVLGCEGWLLATTGPAGPAFEGWGIRFGMRAIEGAIERVKIDPSTLRAEYSVIGNVKPRGICGSGLIDLLAEMFRHKIIDTLGKINRRIKSPYIRGGPDGYEYVVVPKEETAIGRDIVITEKDIANLIDSKSSVCAAISVLLKKMRLSVYDITKVYICGAFGRYLDPNSAIAIGLIPEFPNAEIRYIGNGSLAGAYLALVSTKYRDEAEFIAKSLAYYDLMKDMDFMDEYLAGFVLPGKKELFPTWWEASRRNR